MHVPLLVMSRVKEGYGREVMKYIKILMHVPLLVMSRVKEGYGRGVVKSCHPRHV